MSSGFKSGTHARKTAAMANRLQPYFAQMRTKDISWTSGDLIRLMQHDGHRYIPTNLQLLGHARRYAKSLGLGVQSQRYSYTVPTAVTTDATRNSDEQIISPTSHTKQYTSVTETAHYFVAEGVSTDVGTP